MMNDDEDYTRPKEDPDLQEFIWRTRLVDHYKDKFSAPIYTYTFICGSKQLDYILVDLELVNTIDPIWYLDSHAGVFLDHLLLM